jgi:hypothetical protein
LRRAGDSTSGPVHSRANWWKATTKPSTSGMAPSLAWLSSQGLLGQRNKPMEPRACHQACWWGMGALPECHEQNPHWVGHNDQEQHDLGPKGVGANAFGSGVHHALEPLHFRAPNDIVRYTTDELLDIAAQYDTNEEAAGPLPILGGRDAVLSSSQMTQSGLAVHCTKKDVKGNKKRRKHRPQWVQSRSATMLTRKQTTLIRSTLRLPDAVSSARRGHRQTTSRDS